MNIKIDSLSKSYGKLCALDAVSFEIPQGQLVALLGPNGAGKTTLLRCMCGIAAPDRGRILYDDEEFNRDRIDLRRRFFFLPDFPFIYPQMTVLRHIGMVLKLYHADGLGAENRVIELLKDFDLLPLAEAKLSTLSRGQLYKMALCAVLAVDPELWMLDEPFASGMDPHGLITFKRRVKEATARGRTVIYSTQILDVAEGYSDKVCVIHKAKLHAFGHVKELGGTQNGGVLEELFKNLRENGQ